MQFKDSLKLSLKWLPSVMLLLFYLLNAWDKITNAGQTDKVIANEAVMIATGIFLLLAVALFMYPKTILWGTALLALYMSCIVVIHMIKGKPHELTLLLVIGTVFAAYIRAPQNLT